jgi:uncharacterized protein with von Willebrand factor type A (vWA) domain
VAADLATLAARFSAALRAEGVAVGADRSARFVQAIMVVRPDSLAELYRCALATLVSDPDHIEVLDRVFGAVFGGLVDPAGFRGDQSAVDSVPEAAPGTSTEPKITSVVSGEPTAAFLGSLRPGARHGEGREAAVPTMGSAQERLSVRDFGALTESELVLLAEAMRGFRIATPMRQSRRFRAAAGGRRIDLRQTLRRARRSAAEPLSLSRRTPRRKPRKLVVLCDISGSMEANARAMLQLLYCASGGANAEVFTFATRLTRLTRALAARPADALRHAGELAPDWSGGTRIGAALREFLDTYGARGMARGAAVVIISDGWETGDPDELGKQMARLSKLAHRIVWVNPRAASSRYRPLAGGMAAALPYCDDLVSAHRLDAVDALIQAIAGPSGRRSRSVVAR